LVTSPVTVLLPEKFNWLDHSNSIPVFNGKTSPGHKTNLDCVKQSLKSGFAPTQQSLIFLYIPLFTFRTTFKQNLGTVQSFMLVLTYLVLVKAKRQFWKKTVCFAPE
jgi:hypothetical protein